MVFVLDECLTPKATESGTDTALCNVLSHTTLGMCSFPGASRPKHLAKAGASGTSRASERTDISTCRSHARGQVADGLLNFEHLTVPSSSVTRGAMARRHAGRK